MKLNCVCNTEHWQDPELQACIRQVLPYFLAHAPDFPAAMEHRKHWEFGQILRGLRRLGAVTPHSWLLSVAGGQEELAYQLTNEARWVFLVDIYGAGTFSNKEADASILTNQDLFARIPYNRRRLVVEYMNALDLRFEEGTFNGVFCSSSIEHFGSVEAARHSLQQMHRVLKPGGIVGLTTECIVDGSPPWITETLILFSPELLNELITSVPGLELVEPVDFSVSPATLSDVYPHLQAVEDAQRQHSRYPHIVLEREGRQFTSVSVFLRKVH